ncbi:MAG: hypothetical protein ACJ763_18500 [Bdellovibrionia bacterium]
MSKRTFGITREWMSKKYPMFSENLSVGGFLCKFDVHSNLTGAQFIKNVNEKRVFESYCLEIEPFRGLFYATSGMASRHPPSEYKFSDGGVWVQMGNPEFGGPELQKLDFEKWVEDCLNEIVEQSKFSDDASEPVTRSLKARKSIFS